jgi:hypothetical protein
MKAPPDAIRPITIERVREIIRDAGLHAPAEDELSVLVAMLAGMQSRCNRDPLAELASEPAVVDARGRVTKVPVHLRFAFARGDMRHWGDRKTWHNFAPEVAVQLQPMMKKANPDGPKFCDRDGPLPELIADMLQLVFPDQEITASAVGQYVARWRRKARKTSTRR